MAATVGKRQNILLFSSYTHIMTGESTSLPLRFVWQSDPKLLAGDSPLGDYQVRAHAARVAHARRRRKKCANTAQSKTHRRSKPEDGDITSISQDVANDCANSIPIADIVAARQRPRLFKGNSDPFGCFPIELNPYINQALTFMRDAFFPRMYAQNKFLAQVHGGDFSAASLGNLFWQSCLESISAPGAALACIAKFLGSMSLHMSESAQLKVTQLSLVLMTKSMILLRKSLEKGSGDGPQSQLHPRALFTQVFFLHRASMCVGDQASVALYGTMLNRLIFEGLLDGTLYYPTMYHAVVDFLDISSQLICRTPFDYVGVGRICEGLWDMVEPNMPVVSPDIWVGLHENIRCKQLCQAFIASRHMNAYTMNPLPQTAWPTSTEQKHLIIGWFGTKSVWAIGTAMNLFLDLRDNKYQDLEFTPGERLTQAALALALVFQFRSMVHATRINGIDYRDCSASIMSQLRATMIEVFASCTDHELHEFAGAHLWILFMGTFWEQRSKATPENESGWFREHLIDYALANKKATWTKLKPVLERFAYSDWEQPNGADWFDDVAQDHMLRRRQQLQAEIVLAKLFP
ncbi:hypothetical protein CLAIMM_07432 [Cladophialophora immunda]|nr:hypothetical protein CLAIMM_07432 [Cladophialophora immunda]